MTDFDKLTKLFTEVGINYKKVGKDLKIDSFDIDGANADVFIKFYEDGKYQEFSVYPN